MIPSSRMNWKNREDAMSWATCMVDLPKRATLLACSDAGALGHHRMELPQDLCGMLRWPWIENTRHFGGDGQWS